MGLCTQCGTCAGICPEGAVTMTWTVRDGFLPSVLHERCTDCRSCLHVCPGLGLDFGAHAWWRDGQATPQDFLGPWHSLWFGWAADPAVRRAGASGGVASALLQGAFARGLIDAAICTRLTPGRPLMAKAQVVRTADDASACRGSKYTMAAVNTALRTVAKEPGRYALVGLPCHIQGLRLAQRRSPVLRQRVVLALGIFCGWSLLPQGTAVTARRAGFNPLALTRLAYRGPDWPGGMELVDSSGRRRLLPYPDYFDRVMSAFTPPRCKLCPDALAELADVSMGDAWLDRFAGSPGVSDLVARTEPGERLVRDLSPSHLVLSAATPHEILISQRDTFRAKRRIYRGRRWLRQLGGRALPDYPGIAAQPSAHDLLLALRDLAEEVTLRAIAACRYP